VKVGKKKQKVQKEKKVKKKRMHFSNLYYFKEKNYKIKNLTSLIFKK
jgi:hypothetical protein